MPVLLAYAIKDSTDIFGISGGGVWTPQTTPLGTPLKVNMLQHSVLSYKNNNQTLYNIYTLLNQVICTLHICIYTVTLILFLVFTCFNCIKSENFLAFQRKNTQFMKVCKHIRYLNLKPKLIWNHTN